jgi:hypothetical protein
MAQRTMQSRAARISSGCTVSARQAHEALHDLDPFGGVLVIRVAEDIYQTPHVGIAGVAVQNVLAAAELESLQQPALRKPAKSILDDPRIAANPARYALEPVHEARVLVEEERKLQLHQVVYARAYESLDLVAHSSHPDTAARRSARADARL